jgi:predicted RNase H-like nuclease (RuvC/YqgF family)
MKNALYDEDRFLELKLKGEQLGAKSDIAFLTNFAEIERAIAHSERHVARNIAEEIGEWRAENSMLRDELRKAKRKIASLSRTVRSAPKSGKISSAKIKRALSSSRKPGNN